MSDASKTAQGSAATVKPKIKFKDMSAIQKLAHIGKVMLAIVSMGFIYPNILTD